MHWGCFVWTPTPPLSGRRTPRPGPVCVCVCVPFLAGLGGPASRARFGAPHLFLWPVLVRSLFAQPPPGLGYPVCDCCWVFSFFFSLSRPCCLRRSVFFLPGVPWAWASCGPPPPPPFFFFLRPLVSCVRWLQACGPWRSVVLLLGPPLCFFFYSSSSPPAPFFLFFFCFFLSFFRFCLFVFFLLSPAPVCRLCGSRAALCVPGCGVCWCVLLCRWMLPGCARSVCVVACRVAVWWCVLCCAWCCVGCLCSSWFLLRAAAPCCHLLVPCCGPWLSSVLRCGTALLWCASPRALCCCGALLFRSRWLVLWGVACGCWLFAAGSGCLPLFPAGLCCCGCSCLATWLAALLCAVVCCGAPLPCAVSCVLWCFVAMWCHALAPCCLFFVAGGVGLCLFPVFAVLCCAARRVVRCRFGLRCCWGLMLWRVAVCCGVSLGVLRCGGAALVCRAVLLCRAFSCGVLRPVPCPAMLCCRTVFCWLAVLCGYLRCWCLFFLLSSVPLLKTPAVFLYL